MPAFGKKLKRGEISQLVNFATQFGRAVDRSGD
jgi:hypothetical protein